VISNISIRLSGFFFNNFRRLPETKRHSSLFLHRSGSKFLVVMAAYTRIPSIHFFHGRILCSIHICVKHILCAIHFVFNIFYVQYAFLKHSDLRNYNKIPVKLFKFSNSFMRP